MKNRFRLLFAGSLAQRPFVAGHAWVFLQYLLGFKRLGWDVLFLDTLSPEMCVDAAGQRASFRSSVNLRWFTEVMSRFGLADQCRLDFNHGEDGFGLTSYNIRECAVRAAGLINVMGYCSDPEILAAAPRRVFLDIDPGFGQMWRDLGWADIFKGHDDFVTIGLNIGREGCDVPTCGLNWITTPQPVVLEHWPVVRPRDAGAYTSVVSWRGPFGPIEYKGRTYGLRVHEFRKFVSLPKRTGRRFELAVDLPPSEARDIAMLNENGWAIIDPRAAAGSPEGYQRHIAGSRAEFMVAKNLYVDTHGGWFSDRSICYLASGRPVLAQETGFSDHFGGGGKGLVPFRTLDEAAAGLEEIESDYLSHCRAAREIAEEYFDSDKVLSRLLAKLSIG